MRRIILAASLVAAVTAAEAQDAQNLTLVCHGVAGKLEDHTVTAETYGANGPVYGSATSYDSTQSRERVTVVLKGQGGQIHMPDWLIPPLHGGNDGWFDLGKLTVTADTIKAQFNMNFINHDHFTIDRHTGDIDMKGYGKLSFEGTCERGPDASSPTKF